MGKTKSPEAAWLSDFFVSKEDDGSMSFQRGQVGMHGIYAFIIFWLM